MKRCLVLVEGQTEERFVKDVLAPHFEPKLLYITPIILTTKFVKSGPNFKGGVTTYAKLRADLCKLLADPAALVTTIIDYYGLPQDTPGLDNRPETASAIERVTHVENAILNDVGAPRHFLPFLALHEFEAWLFTDPEETAATIPQREQAEALKDIANGLAPEDINDDPKSAPSKRILRLLPSYRKTLHGPTAAKRIGLNAIRECCPHFNQWMSKLEAFALS